MIARLARTLRELEPIQLLARAPHEVLRRAVRDVPSAAAPPLRENWPKPPERFVASFDAERARASERMAALPRGSRLAEYEATYGLDLELEGALPDWSSRVAVEPYPASVRARRIALATWLGRRDLGPELARAARAVLVHPELHLLGNHVLENGLGLACAGAAAVGVESDVWWDAGQKLLDWQLPRQFLSDGGHEERSASYHLALTSALVETIALADAAERHVPRAWRDVAERALGWMLAVRAPDATYPLFNDASLDAAPTIDEVMAVASALGHVAYVPTSLDVTGWIVLENQGARLVVDAGPDAQGPQPGHAHADGLAFELWIDGARTVVDYGVESYASDEARTRTRATASHNTVELDGLDSCEVWSAFRVGRRGRGRVVRRDATSVELEHDGYSWLEGHPIHRRSITLADRHLLVVDRVTSTARPWTSRLRLDAANSRRVKVHADGRAATGRASSWFPRHGRAQSAVVYEQAARGRGDVELRWRLDW